ncbi:hypothetical protein [Candidatus Albibeggiatoa sp. nov. NOAA]|uniref:hypothetical protein n=1 Tax=Candidatus Albibeggiatoa sp. nov. NOAA TaxID=3162724 RepID=UPI0032F1BF50|nr:hypothetical protein [Thiotrichaceae bacterium]
MKKLLFILDCLMFFVVPVSTILLYSLSFELDENDLTKVTLLIPFLYLMALSSLFISLNKDDDFYIKTKLIRSLIFVVFTLGIYVVGYQYFIVAPELLFGHIAITLASTGFLIYITKTIEEFKKQNNK